MFTVYNVQTFHRFWFGFSCTVHVKWMILIQIEMAYHFVIHCHFLVNIHFTLDSIFKSHWDLRKHKWRISSSKWKRIHWKLRWIVMGVVSFFLIFRSAIYPFDQPHVPTFLFSISISNKFFFWLRLIRWWFHFSRSVWRWKILNINILSRGTNKWKTINRIYQRVLALNEKWLKWNSFFFCSFVAIDKIGRPTSNRYFMCKNFQEAKWEKKNSEIQRVRSFNDIIAFQITVR